MTVSIEPPQRFSGGCLITFGSIFFFGLGLPILIHAIQSYTWPSALGTIRECYVYHETDEDGTSYYLRFTADFVVEGTEYTASQRYLDGEWGSGNPRKLYRFIEQHPIGSSIILYYKPSDPGKATIVRGLKLRHFVIALIGLALLILGFRLWAPTAAPIERWFRQFKNLLKNYTS